MPSSPITNNLSLLPALLPTVALTVGMTLAYHLAYLPLWLLFLAVIVFTAVGMFFLRYPRLRPYPVALAFLFLGAIVMTVARARISVALPEEKTAWEGTVVDSPRLSKRTVMVDVYVFTGVAAGKKIRCYLPKNEFRYVHLGETYAMEGTLRQFDNTDTDGNFNYQRWAASRALVAWTYVRKGDCYDVGNRIENLPFIVRISLKSKLLRERILQLFQKENLSPDHLTLLSAMAFGERSGLSKETRDVFARTGVSHLLALSGLHLGIIYMLLSLIFVSLCGRLSGSVIVVISLWLYALLTGMSASVVRAAMMLSIYTLFTLDPQRTTSVNSLFVAVAVMLLWNPLIIWDAGFQLSVAAVLSIAVFYSPIYNILPRGFLFRNIVCRKLWGLIAVSLSAQIGTFPLVIYYFGRISIWFLFANIAAVPLVGTLLYVVALTLLFWWLPGVKGVFIIALRYLFTALDWVLRSIDSWSSTSIENINISALDLLILYLIVTAFAVAVRAATRLINARRKGKARIPNSS